MNKQDQTTFDLIFTRPALHGIRWSDVQSLLESKGNLVKEHNGNYRAEVGPNALVFHSPAHSDIISVEQVMDLRHLLKGLDEPIPEQEDFHALLVLEHSVAKVYRIGISEEVPVSVEPYDPSGHRHQVHSAHDSANSPETPHQEEFFRSVAGILAGADQIIIFGSGDGSSNAMARFVGWLKQHNELLFSRVVKAQKIDVSHTTDHQLITKAREVYADLA